VSGAMIEDMGREKFKKNNELLISEILITNKNPFVLQMFDSSVQTCINILKVRKPKSFVSLPVCNIKMFKLGRILFKSTFCRYLSVKYSRVILVKEAQRLLRH